MTHTRPGVVVDEMTEGVPLGISRPLQAGLANNSLYTLPVLSQSSNTIGTPIWQ